jgi:hypothetical protein
MFRHSRPAKRISGWNKQTQSQQMQEEGAGKRVFDRREITPISARAIVGQDFEPDATNCWGRPGQMAPFHIHSTFHYLVGIALMCMSYKQIDPSDYSNGSNYRDQLDSKYRHALVVKRETLRRETGFSSPCDWLLKRVIQGR